MQRTHVATVPGTGLELTRLAKVGELVDAVESGQVSVSEATARLDEIDKTPHPWGAVANAISYASIGSAFAVLLSGGWWDVLFSALFSLVVYGMIVMAGRFGARTAEWLPLSSAFVAGVLATTTKMLLPEINIVLITLAAILVLIPGFSISVGIIELVGKHVVSRYGEPDERTGLLGQAVHRRLARRRLVGLIGSIPAAAAGQPVNSQWLWLFMPLLIAGLCVVFQTAPRDLFWACFGTAIAYVGILLGSAIAGSNLGNLFGTIVAVVFANLWTMKTGRPTSIVLLPAVVLLVSGSIGFRGLAAVAAGQVTTGEQQLVQMFVVAFTIAAGLLVGNTIVRPKATLYWNLLGFEL